MEWVWRRVKAAGAVSELVVAVDDPEVERAVTAFGGRAVRTRNDHRSGTDRVAEVVARPEFGQFGWIVNVQGDEPFLPAGAESAVVERVREGWDIATVAVRIASAEEFEDPAVVKVVLDDAGGALYFSRAPIPHGRVEAGAGEEGPPWLRHVGIYAFSRKALFEATQLPSHPLEERERLEQLRWLAAGLRIGVVLMEGGGPGVDTKADVVRAEAILGGREEAR